MAGAARVRGRVSARRAGRLALAGVALGAALVGAGVALGEGAATGLLLLLSAPPLVALALGTGGVALLARRWGLAAFSASFALSIGVTQFGVTLFPRVARGGQAPSFPGAWRGCLDDAAAPDRPVKVLSWNVHGPVDASATEALLADVGAEIWGLEELRDPGLLARLGADSVFEAATEGAPPAGLAIATPEGALAACGGQRRAVFALPSLSGRRVIAVLALVEVAGGVVPVLVAHLDRPSGPSELLVWPGAIAASAEALSGLARAVKHPGLVVMGDTNTSQLLRGFHARMAGAGLTAAPARRTWPVRLGSAPVPALYALDRVWVGAAWRPGRVEVRRGPSDHAALVVQLLPAAQ